MYTCTIGTADTNTREYEICSKEESKQHDVGCDPREVRSKIKGCNHARQRPDPSLSRQGQPLRPIRRISPYSTLCPLQSLLKVERQAHPHRSSKICQPPSTAPRRK